MNQKKIAHSANNSQELSEERLGYAPFLFAIVFFAVVCLLSNDTFKGVTLIIAIATLVVGVARFSVLRQRVGLPLLAMVAVVLMGWISTLYAVSGKFALNEFSKIFVSLCLGLLFLMLAPEKKGEAGRWIAVILSGSTAIAGLVSIDMLSTRIISKTVFALLGTVTSNFLNLNAVETGTRMLSIYQAPNVFAGCAGLGVILALGLVQGAVRGKERCALLCVLYLNALSFILAFSMGASAFIAVAFVLYLLLESSARRGALLVLMVETVIPVAIGMALVAMTSFDGQDTFQLIPLACAVLGCVVLCLLDRFVGQKLGEKLQNRGKTMWVVILAVLAAALAFVLLAYNLTGGTSLSTGESLRRSVYPAPGEYTMSASVDGTVQVKVESQSRQDTMMHTSTVLYSGALEDVAITVPEDSTVVYFTFYAGTDAVLEEVLLSGESGSERVPLGYKLLPGFVANRLQGLFANQNVVQRTVFFADGMKLFHRSPVVGLGMGAYENAIMSVQSFYYQTKYAHNHYIQSLLETGVIGLLLFVGLILVSAVVLIIKRRKSGGENPMVPALMAALVFMAGHAAMEVVFSYYAYLPIAYGVFALINLYGADAIPLRWMAKKAGVAVLGGVAALIVVFGGMLSCNMLANAMTEDTATFEVMARAAEMDPYEWADHMLSYVYNAMVIEVDEGTMQQAHEFAAVLAQVDSNSIPVYLSQFYLSNGYLEEGINVLKKYVGYVSSDSDAWNQTFQILMTYIYEDQRYLDGAREIVAMLDEWNAENMGSISLDEDVQWFRDWLERGDYSELVS